VSKLYRITFARLDDSLHFGFLTRHEVVAGRNGSQS
jgi:hypothetical protein